MHFSWRWSVFVWFSAALVWPYHPWGCQRAEWLPGGQDLHHRYSSFQGRPDSILHDERSAQWILVPSCSSVVQTHYGPHLVQLPWDMPGCDVQMSIERVGHREFVVVYHSEVVEIKRCEFVVWYRITLLHQTLWIAFVVVMCWILLHSSVSPYAGAQGLRIQTTIMGLDADWPSEKLTSYLTPRKLFPEGLRLHERPSTERRVLWIAFIACGCCARLAWLLSRWQELRINFKWVKCLYVLCCQSNLSRGATRPHNQCDVPCTKCATQVKNRSTHAYENRWWFDITAIADAGDGGCLVLKSYKRKRCGKSMEQYLTQLLYTNYSLD